MILLTRWLFKKHTRNVWLKQFRLDFVNGFAPAKIKAAAEATEKGFSHLNDVLSDGRIFLGGDAFSLSDVAWMPNVHRVSLMGWPFEGTPYLKAWFKRVSQRPSYQTALINWQHEGIGDVFETYTAQRRAEGTDVRQFLNAPSPADCG